MDRVFFTRRLTGQDYRSMKTTPVWNCDANPAFRIDGAKRRRTGDGGGTSDGAQRRWRVCWGAHAVAIRESVAD
jgi:hypothetical protein